MKARHVAAVLLLVAVMLLERGGYYAMRMHLRSALEPFFDDRLRASLAYGVLTQLSIFAPLLGGLACVFGPRQLVFLGGLSLILLGLLALATLKLPLVIAGLALQVIGVGLYKAALFLEAAAQTGAREGARTAAFVGLYSAMNLGAFLAPLAVGRLSPQLAFAATAFATFIALACGLAVVLLSPAAELLEMPPAPMAPVVFAILAAVTLPALAVMTLSGELQYQAARESGFAAREWFGSINPLVVVGAGLPLIAVVLVFEALKVRLSGLLLVGFGALLLAVSALPLLSTASPLPLVIGSAAVGALGELLVSAVTNAAAASCVPHRFGALAIAGWLAVSGFVMSMLGTMRLPPELMIPALGATALLAGALGLVAVVASGWVTRRMEASPVVGAP